VDAAASIPKLNDVTRRMIELVGPHAGGGFRRASELLGSDESAAITEFASISRDANAMVHSMPIVTMLSAGEAPNAVPERASALVNLRISAGHSADELIENVIAAVSDPGIEFEVLEQRDASAISPSEGEVWDVLESSIRAVFGDVIVAPYVNNGGTDSRNYTPISDNVYRFNPYDMTLDERRSIHAVDERLRLSSFLTGASFYRHLLERL
jgi:carboxypeptidase PM20D1